LPIKIVSVSKSYNAYKGTINTDKLGVYQGAWTSYNAYKGTINTW